MFLKTDAIVLRVSPFSKTSHVVTWSTKEFGRISTVVKGAVRPKSSFLGQYDQFYTCELLFYEKENNGLHIIKEASPLNYRAILRSDWRAMVVSSYLCDLVMRLSPINDPFESLYPDLERLLDLYTERSATPAVLFWSELQLMKALGLSPQLSNCPSCQKSLDETVLSNGFSYIKGGIICLECARNENEQPSTKARDILAILRAWQRSDQPDTVYNTKCSLSQYKEIQRVMGEFMRYHLDMRLYSRDISLRALFSTLN